MFSKKTPAPTLEQRFASAKDDTSRAIGYFETMAARLERGASEHQAVADQAKAEAARLAELADDAKANADKSAVVAQNLRNLTVA